MVELVDYGARVYKLDSPGTPNNFPSKIIGRVPSEGSNRGNLLKIISMRSHEQHGCINENPQTSVMKQKEEKK